MNSGGMHQIYGVAPDIAAYAKTMSNGFPMAAIVGKRAVMDAAQNTFISSAYWTERVGPAAALATIKKHQRINAGKVLTEVGTRVQQGWRRAATEAGLAIEVTGIPPLASFSFVGEQNATLTTLFVQEMLDRGFLASDRFYANCCHTPAHLDRYLDAVTASFGVIAEAVRTESVERRLRGPIKHSGFSRLT